jgi:putative transposase
MTHNRESPDYPGRLKSFNGKFRDKCLSEHWFITMALARRVIEFWRIEYNTRAGLELLRLCDPKQIVKNRIWEKPADHSRVICTVDVQLN